MIAGQSSKKIGENGEMTRPRYEAQVRFPNTGGVLSSSDTRREAYLVGDKLLYRTVPTHKCRQIGDLSYYDFDSIVFKVSKHLNTIRVIVDKDENPQDKQIWIENTLVAQGRQLTGRMFNVTLRRKRPVSIGTKTIALTGRITYYATQGGSFRVVSQNHIRNMKGIGLNIHKRTLDDLIWKGTRGKAEWGLLHPAFSFFQSIERLKNNGALGSLQMLRKAHRRLGGFEIADSTRISPSAVKMANLLDLVMVPSKCSQAAFKRSGVETQVRVVPHGLSENYSAPPMPSRLVPKKEKWRVLYFLMHSPRRKGADVVHRAMSQILKNLKGVRLVVKTGTGTRLPEVSRLANLPRTTVIDRWLSEKALVKLYDACDVLLSPSLGGGFELCNLEALARGLIPITSDWPAIREYADPHAFIIDDLDEKVKPYAKNPVHTGVGANPDPEHLYGLVYHTFENRESLKRHAAKYAKGFREQYSWESVARRIATCLR